MGGWGDGGMGWGEGEIGVDLGDGDGMKGCGGRG